MSSGKPEGYFQEVLENAQENNFEQETDISRIIIPFSTAFKSYKPIDIYSGTEKIPFRERDLEYKLILKQEFSDILR
jgi:hypothetical protein